MSFVSSSSSSHHDTDDDDHQELMELDLQQQQQQQHDDDHHQMNNNNIMTSSSSSDHKMNRVLSLTTTVILPLLIMFFLIITLMFSQLFSVSELFSIQFTRDRFTTTTATATTNTNYTLSMKIHSKNIVQHKKSIFSLLKKLGSSSSRNSEYEFNDVTILFIHGVPLDASQTWSPLIDQLQKLQKLQKLQQKEQQQKKSLSNVYSFMYPVMRGFYGNSISPQNLNTQALMYDMRSELSVDVKQVIDFILESSGNKTRVLLVGHDLGGMVIHAFASQYGHLYSGGSSYSSVMGIVTVNSPWHFAWNELLSSGRDANLYPYLNEILLSNSGDGDDSRWDTNRIQKVFQVPSSSSSSSSSGSSNNNWMPSRFLQWYYSLFNDVSKTTTLEKVVFSIRDANDTVFRTRGSHSIPVLAIDSDSDPLLPHPTHYASMTDIMREVWSSSSSSSSASSQQKNKDNFYTKTIKNDASHYLPVTSPGEVAVAITEFVNMIAQQQQQR